MSKQRFITQTPWVRRGLVLLLTLSLGFGLVQPARADAIWQTKPLDTAGDLGQFTSVVLDSNGNPVISYSDFSNRAVKLMHCGTPTCASGNTIQIVDSLSRGQYTSLALDASGNPVISYYDVFSRDLMVVKCGNPACSSGNYNLRADGSANDVGKYSSLALNSSGIPVISYYDATTQDLKLMRCGNVICSAYNAVRTVDSAGDVGQHTALVLDRNGNPVISYYDATNGDLKVVHCGDATCASGNVIQVVDSNGYAGQDNSLVLDSNGNPVISYLGMSTNGDSDLKLVYCGNATCSSGNTIQTVDNAGNVGASTSLVLNSKGYPIISYQDFTNLNLAYLKLVHCGNATCSSGNLIQVVDRAGSVGGFSSLVVNRQGNPVITYMDHTNWDLKFAWLVNTYAIGAWGSNTAGESNVPAGLQAIAVTGGRWHSLALKYDGTVVAWGCANGYDYGLCTVPAGLSGVTAISAAPYHNLALKSDGTVVAWGCGTADYGQCAVPAGLSGVKAVAAGLSHSLALKNDGTVVAWGCGGTMTKAPCTIPAGLSGVKAIAAGMNHDLALKNDGTVVGWGYNSYGETNGATAGSGVIAIAAAGSHNLALKSNGTVVAWGDNAAGQNNVPSGLGGVVAIAAGGHHSLALKNDGTVVAWGCGVYNDGQCTVPTGLSGVVAIGGGYRHSLALAAMVPVGGVAASAAVSTDAGQSATPILEGFTFITESVPVSAPATVDAPAQSQRLFLPLAANTSMMAADNSAAGAPVTEAAPQSAAVTATVASTLTLTAVDPNASAPAQSVTTTAPAAVITTSAPVSVPVVEAAPVVTESAPVAVESASVVSASAPVSEPAAVVEAAPVVTETLLLTTTEPVTATDAANPLAGTAVGNRGGIVVLALVGLAVVGSLLWQRRRSSGGR